MKDDRMKNAADEPSSRRHGHDRRIRVLSSILAFESFSRRATDFVSGPWGPIALFGILASWGITIPLVGWTKAYEWISEFITVASFILFRAPVHDASRTWRMYRREWRLAPTTIASPGFNNGGTLFAFIPYVQQL
jgi:hypothetical protein